MKAILDNDLILKFDEAKQQIAQEAKDWDDKFAATPAIVIEEGDIITAADLVETAVK